jgi:hypothetical protein
MVRPLTGLMLIATLGGCNQGGLPARTKAGYVGVLSGHHISNGVATDDTSATASFPQSAAPSLCGHSTRAGLCTATYSCPTTPAPIGGTATDSAGVITIGGGLLSIVLHPDAMPTPYLFDSPGQREWLGGETLTFSATGGSVRAFIGQVRAPAVATISSPALTHNPPDSGLPLMTLTVDRSQDLVFRWAAMPPATINVGFSSAATNSMRPAAYLDCQFDAAAGEGTIAASLLQLLPAGQGSVAVGSSNSDVVTAADWSVTLAADSAAVAADGTEFSFTASLQ